MVLISFALEGAKGETAAVGANPNIPTPLDAPVGAAPNGFTVDPVVEDGAAPNGFTADFDDEEEDDDDAEEDEEVTGPPPKGLTPAEKGLLKVAAVAVAE